MATAIDVGKVSWGRYAATSGRTYIGSANPANATGQITSVQIGCFNDPQNTKFATFYGSSNDYMCRAYQLIGTVTTGTYTGLAIPITTGDLLGWYSTQESNHYILNESLTAGWYKTGDHTADGSQTYTYDGSYCNPTMYGTGATIDLFPFVSRTYPQILSH